MQKRLAHVCETTQQISRNRNEHIDTYIIISDIYMSPTYIKYIHLIHEYSII